MPVPTPDPSFSKTPIGFDAARRLLSELTSDPDAALVPSGLTPEHASDDDPAAPAPDHLPGYLIESVLGRGAGGLVYRAYRNGGTGEPVAIKILHRPPGLHPDSPQSQRAWRELHVLSELRLPCLPRVLDYGWHPRGLYIVTEFVQGLHLDRYCDQHRLGLRERVELLARLCDCVQSLHERGVIHRDLKPSNVLIDERRQPVIIDLGLAAVLAEGLDPTHTLTADGTPLGTPAFMSPEQARGERVGGPRAGPAAGEGVTTRSDVYSLGAAAYVLLTGETPHDMRASLHEAVRRVAQDPPREPRTLEPSLPKPLAAVLMKACGPESGHRYASAADLALDLRRWLKGEAVEASATTHWRRALRWADAHPRASTASLLLSVVLLSLVAVLGYRASLDRQPSHVEVNSGRTQVSLVARSGRVLGTWRGEQVQAAALTGPAGPERRRYLLLSILNSPDLPRRSQQLVAFDTTDLTEPRWASGSPGPEFDAPGIPCGAQDSFPVAHLLLADLFPAGPAGSPTVDCEGEEAVVCLRHHSQGRTQMRVYSASGKRLYSAWHSGTLEEPRYIAAEKLLVLSGVSNASPIDLPNAKTKYRHCVFGIEPSPERRFGWINRTDPHDANPAPVRFYRLIGPAVFDALFTSAKLRAAEHPAWQETGFGLDLTNGEPIDPAHVALTFDAQGRMPAEPVFNESAWLRGWEAADVSLETPELPAPRD